MSRMQQVIKALEAEREEVQERLAWLDQTIEEFRAREARPAQTDVDAPTPAAASKRQVRRGTAARASKRRHVARDLKVDSAERVLEFLKAHPGSTIGAVAKGLDANRSTIAAAMDKLVKTGEIHKGQTKGYTVVEERSAPAA